MNYFLDTEFYEYHKQSKCLGIKIGKSIPTIDLISIGIVGEDIINKRAGLDGTKIPYMQCREYYAISKDFNIKDAWYSWQPKQHNLPMGTIKEYWLRDNVLKPILRELIIKAIEEEENSAIGFYTSIFNTEYNNIGEFVDNLLNDTRNTDKLLLDKLTQLIDKYGKTNEQIAAEVKEFVYKGREIVTTRNCGKRVPINFYGYYADYDWVVFAQLFGKMTNLREGFPMYCRDLNQMLEEKAESLTSAELSKLAYPDTVTHNIYSTYDTGILDCSKTDLLKYAARYPKQINEHNALADANWNKKLYRFLNTI